MPSNYLEPRQSRPTPPSAYEVKLAGTIEEIFGRGVHDLPGLLAELNDAGLLSPDGTPWDERSFAAELHRLGA